MPLMKAARVIVEFEDGSTAESDFEKLPSQLQSELMRQPFASQAPTDTQKDKFLFLEWEDGWKEIIRVDPTCSEINRYYVISRVEDVGRLSINKEDGYPELIEIPRRPMALKRIHFLDTFSTSLERSDREGKKTDHFFKLSKEGNMVADIEVALKQACADTGIDVAKIRSSNPIEANELLEQLRRKMDLKASFRAQDVYDFIAGLAHTVK